MWTFISVSLALKINFYIPENKKSMIINENDYQRIGFPYQYFEGELLSEEEVHYRLRLIKISLMMYFRFACSVVPRVGPVVGQVVLPLPPTSIERLIPNQLDSETRNIVKTALVLGIYLKLKSSGK